MNVRGDILGNNGSLMGLINLMGHHEISDEFYDHSLNTAILRMVVAGEWELPQDDAHMVGMAAWFQGLLNTVHSNSQ